MSKWAKKTRSKFAENHKKNPSFFTSLGHRPHLTLVAEVKTMTYILYTLYLIAQHMVWSSWAAEPSRSQYSPGSTEGGEREKPTKLQRIASTTWPGNPSNKDDPSTPSYWTASNKNDPSRSSCWTPSNNDEPNNSSNGTPPPNIFCNIYTQLVPTKVFSPTITRWFLRLHLITNLG